MHKFIRILFLLLTICLSGSYAWAGQVPVHDPSVIIVYKDKQGNSFPNQSANNDREKFYYVFGTQLGAAYSRDMLDWTAFTPSFSVGGKVSNDLCAVFGENTVWSGWINNQSKLKENLWAADIIWNKDLKKWCMYYSINGDDWMSSICMLASEKIEGPYERVGSVVFGGMDTKSRGAGNDDFKRVTGQSSIPDRYFTDGGWGGIYGSSCIDPNVLYDEQGGLWLFYGSWSGGIFAIKLDNKTGLRDYSYNYGYTTTNGANWQGNRLRYDEYMGVHVAGGYYVSGEGPYIEYIKNGNEGYYYLFMSYGFYSPEGGYNMRLFKSKNITGPYTDVTGDDAVFDRKLYPNYGNNVTYGVSLMQNYSWGWWGNDKTITDYGQVGGGQTAQGHNSALMDEDGKCYIIYHTKDNTGNGYGWHHVESHPMVFASDGWPLVAPFETRLGEYTDRDTLYSANDIIGEYSVLTHNAVDYAKLVCNKPGAMSLNADHSITGDYSGTWQYDKANGGQYITLKTSKGTFNGTLIEQRIEDDSRKTLCLTAMNPANELCVWAFRKPQTKNGTETKFEPLFRVGTTDKSLVWNEKEKFLKVDAPEGDFEVRFSFHNYNKAVNNWDNWQVRFEEKTNDNTWILRADGYSVETFANTTVTYSNPKTWKEFDDKDIEIVILRQGSSIHLTASVDNEVIYGVLSKNSPKCAMNVFLGGESTYLDVRNMSVASLNNRENLGAVTNFGTYTDKFNVSKGARKSFTGDFKTHYSFNNFHSNNEDKNWNNFIIRNTVNGKVGYIRSDAYQFDSEGEISFKTSWGDDWNYFLKMLKQAKVDVTIERVGSTITYNCVMNSFDGLSGEMVVTQKGINSENVTIELTEEASVVDVLSVMDKKVVTCEIQEEDATSLVETRNEELKIIPTVTSDIVTIHLTMEEGEATLHESNGIVLAKKSTDNGTITFDLSKLTNGVYVVVSEGSVKKVVKK